MPEKSERKKIIGANLSKEVVEDLAKGKICFRKLSLFDSLSLITHNQLQLGQRLNALDLKITNQLKTRQKK